MNVMKVLKAKRAEAIAYFVAGKSCREIARMLHLSESTVSLIMDEAMKDGDINSDLRVYAPHPDIKAVNYTHHDEYSKHFAGAEFEDNRPPELRGMDWPMKFERE